jgi:Cobalamin-independent synthase, Catalytic domain
MSFPWPRGSATGVGSLPGVDIVEAQKTVLGELPDLPHLAELPDRGPGADMIGRAAAMLVELPVELYAARWRVASRPGHDLRVARDFRERDLDTLTELASEYDGVFKIQVAGPWTLAAALDLPIGGLVLRDPGAVRDLAASLAEGVRGHVREVQARLPNARVLLQVDEPSLPAVLAGRVPTESGLGTLRPVPASTAREVLASTVASDVPTIAHCCAAAPPLALLQAAGFSAVGLDLGLSDDLDALGTLIDDGTGLFAGVAPGSPAAIADAVKAVWSKLGFPAAQLGDQVVVTPPCGLAGTPSGRVRKILAAYREAGQRLGE